MREILFRGKRLDNGEWIEGGYFAWVNLIGEYQPLILVKTESGFSYNQVFPETVSQFTGLTFGEDKLFEGDIIAYEEDYDDSFGYPKTAVEHLVVIWDEENCAYGVKANDEIQSLNDLSWGYVTVIGNIFDNPELMEGGGSDE